MILDPKETNSFTVVVVEFVFFVLMDGGEAREERARGVVEFIREVHCVRE